MAIQVTERPFPLAGEEVQMAMTVRGGTDLSARAIVKAIMGKNDHTAAVDGYAVGDYLTDNIVATSNDAYPASGLSDYAFPQLGLLLEATADDKDGQVLFRGFVKDLVLGTSLFTSTPDILERGDFIVFDQSGDILEVAAAADLAALGVGDFIVGRILETTTITSGAATATVDSWLDFINTQVIYE